MATNSIFYVKKTIYGFIVFLFLLFLSSCNSKNIDNDPYEIDSPTNLKLESNYTSSKETEYYVSFDEVESADGYIIKIASKEIDIKENRFNITDFVNIPGTPTIIVKAYKNYNGEEIVSIPNYVSEKIYEITPSMTYNLLEDGTYEVSCESCSKSEITGTVVFPDNYNGIRVTKIAMNCLFRIRDSYEVVGYTDTGEPMLSVEMGINHYTTKVILPKFVTVFGTRAFAGCIKLEQFDIPSKIIEIGSGCFSRCELFTSAVIPDGITGIGCFRNCTALKEVYLPATVKYIYGACFENCVNLEKINIDNVEIVEDLAFNNTKFIEKYTEDFLVICNYLYKYQGNLKNLTFENYPIGLVGISVNFFRNLSDVELVAVPYLDEETALYYGINSDRMMYTFTNSNNLKTIIIDDGYTSINNQVFRNLPNLETVVIPKSVKKIGMNFYGCDKFSNIYYMGTSDEWNDIEIDNFAKNAIKYVFYYSENKPTEEGNYWHYVGGIPTPWN